MADATASPAAAPATKRYPSPGRPCPACQGSAPPGAVHGPMPVYTQYQSPGSIAAIAYQGADPADDPLWHRSGAASRAEYAYWCRHACGMACLQMVLHHRDGRTPPLLDLFYGCADHGGYVRRPDGSIHGLIYAPFAGYVRSEHGLTAAVHPELPLAGLRSELDRGCLVMASVHPEIRRPDRPAPGRGGHLVLVTGHDSRGLHFRNPSGHTPAARSAVLPAEVFASFYAGRGVALRPC